MGGMCSIGALEDEIEATKKTVLGQSNYYLVKLYEIFDAIKVEADGAGALVQLKLVQPETAAGARQIDVDTFVQKVQGACCGCGDAIAKAVTALIAKKNAELSDHWTKVKAAYAAALVFLTAYEAVRLEKATMLSKIPNTALQTLDTTSVARLLTLSPWTNHKANITSLVTSLGYADPITSDARAQLKAQDLPDTDALVALTNDMVITFGRAVLTAVSA